MTRCENGYPLGGIISSLNQVKQGKSNHVSLHLKDEVAAYRQAIL